MGNNDTERDGTAAARILSDLVAADLANSLHTQVSLADAADIPRETFRRKLRRGEFTVPELYRVAAALGAEPLAWVAQIEATVSEQSA